MITSQQEAKPFEISKWLIWEAYRRVKANRGAAGVDGETIEQFEVNLQGNLYKLWNRMSSGSYFPAPVRAVDIPKASGGKRTLGVPTVTDRIAQTAAAMLLEPEVEPMFHPDSYGYRPGRSALDAVGVCRRRCWQTDWVIDLDIRSFFDSLDHELLMRAVERHIHSRWILLYLRRWLTAPLQGQDGTLTDRKLGTPQGSPISPVLANIYLHYTFDTWMARSFPGIQFERYADDVIVHCESATQARIVLAEITARLARCRLDVHPEKTRIVYCKDANRRGSSTHERFDFLGYTFRSRLAKSRHGVFFASFSPAVADSAAKEIRRTVRRWRLHLRSGQTLDDLARWCNPILQGWINYYGRFHRSALHRSLSQVSTYLVRWVMKKYKRFRGRPRRARWFLTDIARRQPGLFAHWKFGVMPAAG